MGGYALNEQKLNKYYDSYKQTSPDGYVSFNKYKSIAASTGARGISSSKYALPNEENYGAKEYADLTEARDKLFFTDVNAAASAEVQKLGGGGAVRSSSGSRGNPEEEGYSERIRGNIRKAIGRNGT